MRPARFLLVPLLAALAAAGACVAPAPPDSTLRAYLPTEPGSLNFISDNDRGVTTVARLVADTLVDFDREIRVVPRLALSWEASPDGREVVFHLRPGVLWHDGAPLTAADVAFTLGKVLDPEALAAGKRAYFDTVSDYEALDPLTFRVRRREPYARAVDVWVELPILPRHLLAEGDFLTSPLQRAPVGSGPYRFVSWTSGDRLVLEANPSYFGARPSIQRLIFRPLPDPSTRVEALLAGDLDLTSLRPLDVERIEGNEDLARRVRVLRQETLFVWYAAWNQADPASPFADRRVRLALTLAADRQGFVDHVLMGQGEVATSLVHPSMWAYDPGVAPWPYDPARAAQLLDEAGWTSPQEGGLRVRGGRPFRFTLLVPAGNQELERFAAILQESLRQLSVEMEIRSLEFSLLRRLRDSGQFEAILGGWSLDPDPDCYDFWHSSQGGGRGLNHASYADAEVDSLCEAARRTLSIPERTNLYHRVLAILHRDQPNTFIAYRRSLTGTSRRLAGVEPSPLGLWGWYPGPLLWRLEEEAAP